MGEKERVNFLQQGSENQPRFGVSLDNLVKSKQFRCPARGHGSQVKKVSGKRKSLVNTGKLVWIAGVPQAPCSRQPKPSPKEGQTISQKIWSFPCQKQTSYSPLSNKTQFGLMWTPAHWCHWRCHSSSNNSSSTTTTTTKLSPGAMQDRQAAQCSL